MKFKVIITRESWGMSYKEIRETESVSGLTFLMNSLYDRWERNSLPSDADPTDAICQWEGYEVLVVTSSGREISLSDDDHHPYVLDMEDVFTEIERFFKYPEFYKEEIAFLKGETLTL